MSLSQIKFKSYTNNNYIYDGETNTIFFNPKENEFKLLDNAISFNKNYYCDIINKYQEKKEYNLSNKVTKPEVKNFIENEGFLQLTLVVTWECNLRCNYCTYSKEYPSTRNHERNVMDFSTAKKAIDYYIDKFSNIKKRYPNKKPAITFYGGEPLLEFNLLKDIINYTKTKVPLEDIIFNISTNGTLLTEESINFFINNNVTIFISLDGPKEEHDRNRLFPNKKGSFNIVYANIQKIKQINESYYYKNTMLLSTYDWESDLISINRFHEENDIPKVAIVNPVVQQGTNYYNKFSLDTKKKFDENVNTLYQEYYQHKTQRTQASSFLQVFIGLKLLPLIIRYGIGNQRPNLLPFTGTCCPGNKLCVQPNGKIDICERVNGQSPIGHTEYGLNYNKIVCIINSYNAVLENCSHCSVRNICQICYSHFNSGDSFKLDNNLCENFKRALLNDLSFYVSILEKNNKAFQDYTIVQSCLYSLSTF